MNTGNNSEDFRFSATGVTAGINNVCLSGPRSMLIPDISCPECNNLWFMSVFNHMHDAEYQPKVDDN